MQGLHRVSRSPMSPCALLPERHASAVSMLRIHCSEPVHLSSASSLLAGQWSSSPLPGRPGGAEPQPEGKHSPSFCPIQLWTGYPLTHQQSTVYRPDCQVGRLLFACGGQCPAAGSVPCVCQCSGRIIRNARMSGVSGEMAGRVYLWVCFTGPHGKSTHLRCMQPLPSACVTLLFSRSLCRDRRTTWS